MDLSVLDEEEIVDCTDKHMLQQASSVKDLFSGYPSVLTRLTRLSLYNLCFARWDLHHHLFECCNQLRYLSLSNCDVGKNAIWKISAPNSNIIVLELDVCCFEKLEVLCLPKLKRLNWDTWLSLMPRCHSMLSRIFRKYLLSAVQQINMKDLF